MSKEQKSRISEFERLLEDVRGTHSKRMNALLVTLDDEDFVVNYFKALEFASPKLQRREIIEEVKDTTITIEHTFSSDFNDEQKEDV